MDFTHDGTQIVFVNEPIYRRRSQSFFERPSLSDILTRFRHKVAPARKSDLHTDQKGAARVLVAVALGIPRLLSNLLLYA